MLGFGAFKAMASTGEGRVGAPRVNLGPEVLSLDGFRLKPYLNPE